jgi:hypothetical protein
MIHVRVRQRDGLQLKAAPSYHFDNRFGLVARINADGPAGSLAPDDARVLLKGCNGQFFDNHNSKPGRKARCRRLIAERHK